MKRYKTKNINYDSRNKMDYFMEHALYFCMCFLYPQHSDAVYTANVGDGADGAVTISTAKIINTQTIATGRTYADGIAYRVTAPADGATAVTRYTGTVTLSNGLVAGDEVLLINLQGTSADNADVGNYEFMQVQSVAADTITFTTPITKSFNGTSAANQKVIIQRVPNYTNVTFSGTGSLTAQAWDGLTATPSGAAGYYTGIVAFRANGTVTIASGTSITVAAKGFQGGSGAGATGAQGESYAGTGLLVNTANYGGGGGSQSIGDQYAGSGGGGGSYGTQGGWGGVTRAYPGNTYGSANMASSFWVPVVAVDDDHKTGHN